MGRRKTRLVEEKVQNPVEEQQQVQQPPPLPPPPPPPSEQFPGMYPVQTTVVDEGGYYGPQTQSQALMGAQYGQTGGQKDCLHQPCMCCNISLKTGCICIAIFGLVIGLLAAVGYGMLFIYAISINCHIKCQYNPDASIEQAIRGLGIFNVIICIIDIIVNVSLLLGASMKSKGMCMVWFICELISIALAIISFAIVGGIVTQTDYPNLEKFLIGLGHTIKLYFLWVVGAYIKELHDLKRTAPQYGQINPTQSNTQMEVPDDSKAADEMEQSQRN